MSHKAPSAGTKVTLGANAPIKQEGPGAVPPDSLAAESQAFKQANAVGDDTQESRPQEGASASARAPGTSSTYTQSSMPRETGSSGGAPAAPTYVQNQYIRDPSGPHGKNIKEDNSIGTEDRAKNASLSAEIGSKDDPALLAERKFTQANTNTVAPGNVGGRERPTEDKTTYDVLGDQEA
ncbi:hypothetical protein F5Y07DRAFT_349969 [Xylaria sp. FL0933]|nr:hypothetical protein F5Y07DRAFT_349969 [Xylaria sp. FL0933]